MDFFDPVLLIVIVINLILMAFARKILSVIYHEPDDSPGFRKRVTVFRLLNTAIIISFLLSQAFENQTESNPGYAIVSIITIIYLSYAVLHLLHYWIRTQYGKKKNSEGEGQYLDTYNSRILNIFSSIFVFIIALISIVRTLGFDTLLEAGGAIGIIGVFLALTQSSWAPDIISGLVILNSKMMDVGDVIEFNDGRKTLGIVYKTRIFYTEILNLQNNHRIMINNHRLRAQTIHNLSKFSSAKGLRECLLFKIDYNEDPEKIRQMFTTAYERIQDNKDITTDDHNPIEIVINETGDFAIEWACYYYTKDVKNILLLRQRLREMIWTVSKEQRISLATPKLQFVKLDEKDV